MHYLVTGHTGFKGAWLCLLLTGAGHRVSGLALDPLPGSLYEVARVGAVVEHDERIDVRNAKAVTAAVEGICPDVVIHLAAQPLVRASYRDPRTTFETNVLGTLNLLEAVSATPSVRAHLVITTDKVYRNVGQRAGYAESDALGGRDPYSASKAMADLMVQSWVESFPGVPTAIARAGNVIGGGDVSPDRLLPDLLASFSAGRPTEIRSPDAIRPWQHVLDCLNGYLLLTDALLEGRGSGAWNFGPDPQSLVAVSQLADNAAALWGEGASWVSDTARHPHEEAELVLDVAKAERELGWHNRLPFPASLEWTIDWQRSVAAGARPDDVTRAQLERFAALASS